MIRLNERQLTRWLDRRGSVSLQTAPLPSSRAVVNDGAIYDPSKLPIAYRTEDHDSSCDLILRTAPDGTIIAEQRYRPFYHPVRFREFVRSKTLTSMATGVLLFGALPAIMGFMSGELTVTGIIMAPIVGFSIGVIYAPFFILFAGLMTFLAKKTGWMDKQALVTRYSDLPNWAPQDLDALCSIEGWDRDSLDKAAETTETAGVMGLLSKRLELYETPDERWVMVETLRFMSDDGMEADQFVRLYDRDRPLRTQLLNNEQYGLYRRAFGGLPYPDAD